jgi:hypothetical protein
MTTFESGWLNTNINIRNESSTKQLCTFQGRHLTSQGGGFAYTPPSVIKVHLPR